MGSSDLEISPATKFTGNEQNLPCEYLDRLLFCPSANFRTDKGAPLETVITSEWRAHWPSGERDSLPLLENVRY